MGESTGPSHGGARVVETARRHGVTTMFTLSGGHVFPVYDGAVKASPPMPIVDVRHEQTAVFAAEATARLTRLPGLAVVTAGPGVTNAVSALASARFNGSAIVTVAGRAPDYRWGAGSLQEFDHPAMLGPVTKDAGTVHDAAEAGRMTERAFRTARAPHRGPVFLDFSLEAIYGEAGDGRQAGTDGGPGGGPAAAAAAGHGQGGPRAAATGAPDAGDVSEIARLLTAADRPVLVLGSDVWLGGAETAARAAAEELRLPVITNGQGRGILPGGHDLLVTRARKAAFSEADLVLVVGTPLDFRLGYGEFGGADGGPAARVVHVADTPGQLATHRPLAASAAGDLAAFFTSLAGEVTRAAAAGFRWEKAWLPRLRENAAAAITADAPLLASGAAPIHPMRIYGELSTLLSEDTVVIGDGGDFVSYAGKHLEPELPGCWLDPGPFGCLGTGLGYAMAARIARPSAPVVLLLGDGAAGFSLMDVDTLVRHRLPVVMVCGNNGAWGLEKHPMRALYGYDVAADLQPDCRYDAVVSALGGAGETVTQPSGIAPALRRAFSANVPYLVNVLTDPEVAYPRATTGL